MSIVAGCSVVVPEQQDEHVEGKLRIRYWQQWTGVEGEAIQKIVDRFNASQDRIYVDYMSVGRYDRKRLVAIAGGNPPDVMGFRDAVLAQYVENRALICLDPYMEKHSMHRDDFIDVYIDMGVYKDELYALPTTPATIALHWNKDLFEEAGLDPDQPPRTIAELDMMVERLTKFDEHGRLTQIGFMHAEPGWWSWSWGPWFGAKLWDGGPNITFDTPETLSAFKWIQGYTDRYGADAMEGFFGGFQNQFMSPQNGFFSGKVAMVIQGVWMSNFIQTYKPDLRYGVAPFPPPEEGMPPFAIAQTDSICIPVGARHPDEAFEFIAFLCSQKSLEQLNTDMQKFSPLKTVSREFIENHPNPHVEVFMDLARSPNVFHVPQVSIWYQYRDEIRNAFDRVRLGMATPEEVLPQVQQTMQEEWNKEHFRTILRDTAEKKKPS
jgi:multiple sugar transport system substrate-binding protein